MDSIDNLKKLGKKENWKYLVVLIWLLIGVGVFQFEPIIGVIIFLPFLTFLMFLFLMSLIAKKDVKEIATWKVLLIFIAALPVMLLISILLVILFAFSILSYIFLTSWFILYGANLSSKRLDRSLKKRVHSSFLRGIVFFGGLALSLLLLIGYFLGSQFIGDLVGSTLPQVTTILNYVVIFVGIMIIFFALIALIFFFKGISNAWLGLFFVYLVIYTFYLLIKIFLAVRTLTGESSSSIYTLIILLLVDFGILLYSVSTLMGSQAEMLRSKLKLNRIGTDTILLWLVFSKVAYEFAHNFPYDLLKNLPIPYIGYVAFLNEGIVNFFKNIAVLFSFLLILFILGFYEIRKYSTEQKGFLKEVDKEVKDLLAIRLETRDLSNAEKTEESEILEESETIEGEFSEDNVENEKLDNSEKNNVL